MKIWVLKEVATKTNDVAGDGTTTATVLAQAMVREGLKNVAAGANPMVIRQGIQQAVETAVEAIGSLSQKIETKEEIAVMGFSQYCTFDKMKPVFHDL